MSLVSEENELWAGRLCLVCRADDPSRYINSQVVKSYQPLWSELCLDAMATVCRKLWDVDLYRIVSTETLDRQKPDLLWGTTIV